MKAVLVSVQLPSVGDEEFHSSLAELKRLTETLGFEVIGMVTQKRQSLAPAAAVGEGKLCELAAWTGGPGPSESHDKDDAFSPPTGRADKVIFDGELTPNQLDHLQKATGAEVLDRTGVIVEIFHRHAKTREARLQVEIARLRYLAPRIRVTGAGERQGGGIGAKGIGETKHELDKRHIRDRIAQLQHELEDLAAESSNRRDRRRDLCRVALVGYTNAGKSSLMRALTGSEVLVMDKLFATLDTTVRSLQPDIFPRVLISDTVGFIQKLPHDLVASFRSTLDEAAEASLLLFVVDASDPTFRNQFEVTRSVLAEIDGSEIPSYLVLNKIDLLSKEEIAKLKTEFKDALFISTRNPEDIKHVKSVLRDFVSRILEEGEFLVRYDDKTGKLGQIRKTAAVIKETHEPEGVRLLIRSFPEVIQKLKKL